MFAPAFAPAFGHGWGDRATLAAPRTLAGIVIADPTRMHVARASMDPTHLIDPARSMEIVVEIADEMPGQPDSNLVWRENARATWVGGVSTYKPNANPSLGVFGPELVGKRIRTRFLPVAGTVSVGAQYEVAPIP